MLTFHNHQQRFNRFSLTSIESELLRKQNFWQTDTWICSQKRTQSIIIVCVSNMVRKLRTSSHSWVYDMGQTFSFSHCIFTLFIWCCRVCYFAWRTRVLWGHHVQWRNWRGGRGVAVPPGRSFRSFWAPCHHIVNFIKLSLIDIAARQCVVLMIFGTLNYKDTLFLENYRKTSHHFFSLEHRNQTLLKNSAQNIHVEVS